jgi:hypothetical protein
MGNMPFVFRFGDIEVREREFSLVKAGAILPIGSKVFRVLLILLRTRKSCSPRTNSSMPSGATPPSLITPSPATSPSSAASSATKPGRPVH